MKKQILLIALLMLTGTLSAQHKKFTWGPKAGVSVTNVSQWEMDFKAGLYAGAFVEYKLTKLIGLSPEIVYSQQGSYTEGYIGDYYTKIRINANYLNIPVLLKIYPIKNLSVDFGPQVGFLLNMKAAVKVDGSKAKENIDQEGYNTTDVSLAMGLSYNLFERIIFSARYNQGLTNVISEAGGNKNNVFQFGIGYRF